MDTAPTGCFDAETVEGVDVVGCGVDIALALHVQNEKPDFLHPEDVVCQGGLPLLRCPIAFRAAGVAAIVTASQKRNSSPASKATAARKLSALGPATAVCARAPGLALDCVVIPLVAHEGHAAIAGADVDVGGVDVDMSCTTLGGVRCTTLGELGFVRQVVANTLQKETPPRCCMAFATVNASG